MYQNGNFNHYGNTAMEYAILKALTPTPGIMYSHYWIVKVIMPYSFSFSIDYSSNPPLYPQWQAYFRKYQPPTLIVWGGNDEIFPAAGAYPYKRDLKNIDFIFLIQAILL